MNYHDYNNMTEDEKAPIDGGAARLQSAFRGWRVRVSIYRMYLLHGFEYPHGFAEAHQRYDEDVAFRDCIEWFEDFIRKDKDGNPLNGRGPVLIMED